MPSTRRSQGNKKLVQLEDPFWESKRFKKTPTKKQAPAKKATPTKHSKEVIKAKMAVKKKQMEQAAPLSPKRTGVTSAPIVTPTRSTTGNEAEVEQPWYKRLLPFWS